MSRPINGEDVYRAIAHPTRRKIIEILKKQPLSPTELLASFKLSQPTLSRHLRVLETAGLVSNQRRGVRREYVYDPKRLRVVAKWANSVS